MNEERPSAESLESGPRDRLPRREVMRYFAGAGIFLASGGVEIARAHRIPEPGGKGYGTDPELNKLYEPGDVWPLTMTEVETKAATALADLLLPADDYGPAASALRVPEFIDEWISAPYPDQQEVRPVIRNGLKWIDQESQKRFQKDFSALSEREQRAICDDICEGEKAKPEFKKGAVFFVSFRSLAMGAYYSTPVGWKAIGYVGNVARESFDGPPPEVLKKLGLEQTVK